MKRLIMAATILVLMIMLYSGEDLFLSDRGRTSSTDIDAVLYDGVDSSSAKTRDNNWEIRTVDSVGDVGRYPSIAIDSDDHLHVSYFYDTGDDLRYAYHNGNNWTIETVDSFGIVGKNTSLALDSDDHPHISYFNETGGDLKYAYHDGTQWNIETVDSFGTVGKYTSIALDSDDHPHISYFNDTGDDLKYAYYNGNSWMIETVDSFGIVGKHTSIGIDSSDHPHISYFNDTGDDLKYAYNNGSYWIIETVDSFGALGIYTSIVIGPDDNPHISYCNASNTDLKYAYFDGSVWNTATPVARGIINGPTSIAIDSGDNVFISYFDDAKDDLKLARYDGEQWRNETVDSEGLAGKYSSLAIDSGDHLHICYYDGTNLDLKYARHDGYWWHDEAVDWQGFVGKYTSIAIDSDDRVHISYYDETSEDLKYACYNGYNWTIEAVDSFGVVGMYTSIALDSDDHPHISYFNDTGGDLKHAYYDGNDWNIETVDSNGTVGMYTSIALDPADYPHISYFCDSNDDLKYASYNGNNWTIETVDSFFDVGYFTSIALDSTNRSHISYYNATGDDLKYAFYDGNQWQIETIDWSGDVGNSYTSIALDSGDHPHIGYRDNTNDDLKYAYHDGNQWHNDTIDSQGDVGDYPSISIDTDDHPHISYYKGDAPYEGLKYSYYDGNNWHNTTVDGEGDVGKYTSIALDSGDAPHIGYYDDSRDDLKYAVIDNEDPTLDSDDSPESGTTGDSFIFDISASDNKAVDSVNVTWSHGNLGGNVAMNDDGDGTWSFNLTLDHSLDDLKYSVQVNDTTGNSYRQSEQTISVTDNDNPALDSDDSPNAGTTGDNFVFDVTVSDNIDVQSVNVTWSHGNLGGNAPMNDDGDGTWSLTIALDDSIGDLGYRIQVNDSSGNYVRQAEQAVSVTDNDNPTLVSDDSPNAGTTGDNFVFDVTVSDNIDVQSVNVTWSHGNLGGNAPMNDDGDGTWSLTITLDNGLGDLSYRVQVNDSSANYVRQAEQTVQVTDNDDPTLDADNSPASGTTGDNYVFDVTISDNIGVDSVNVTWSHGDLGGNEVMNDDGDGTWSFTITLDNSLGDLSYSIQVNDTSGNYVRQAEQAVQVTDNDYPILISDDSPNAGTTGDSFVFDVTVSDNIAVDGVNVTWSHGNLGGKRPMYDDGDGTWSLNITLDDSLGDLSYSIQVNDTSANYVRQADQTVSVTDNDNPSLDSDDSPNTGTTGDNFMFDVTVSDNIGVQSVNVTWSHGNLGGNAAMTDDGDGTWSIAITLDHNLNDMTYSIQLNDTSGVYFRSDIVSVSLIDNDFPYVANDNSAKTANTGDMYSFDIIPFDNIGVYSVQVEWTHGNLSGNDAMNDDGDGTWSLNITLDDNLTDMTYTIQVADVSGSSQYNATVNVTVTDNDVPILNEDDSPNAGTTGDNFVFDITVSDNIGVASVNVTWSHGNLGGKTAMVDDGDGTWSVTITLDHGLSDLTYSIQVNDTSGNYVRNATETVSVMDNDDPLWDSDDSANAGTTGDNFVFDVTVSDNIGIDRVYVNWAHGALGDNESMTDDGDGTWSFTIVLDDDLGNLTYYIWFNDTSNNEVNNATETVVVTDNDDPALILDKSPISGTTGDQYTFDITVSDNIAVDSVNVTWSHGDLGGNVAMINDGDGTWSLNITLDHSLGDLSYSIQVNDTSGNHVRNVTAVHITDNVNPSLIRDNSPGTGTTGDQYTFDIAASDNIDVANVTVAWSHGGLGGNVSMTDDGDGTWSLTVVLDHSVGSLSYRVEVKDTSGNYIRNATETIEVTDNDAPTFHGDHSPSSGTTGDTYRFNVTGSDNIGIVSIKVNWSHGSAQGNSTLTEGKGYWAGVIDLENAITPLTYRIFIMDEVGNLYTGEVTTVGISDNDLPVCNAENMTIDQHQAAAFNGSMSIDNIGIVNYTWNFEYGSKDHTLYGENPKFTFHSVGIYNVSLNVTDAGGNHAENTFTVTVLDITPPSPDAGGDVEVFTDVEVTLTGNATDNVAAENYTWALTVDGKEHLRYGRTFRFTFRIPGMFNVTLTVTDTAGNHANDTVVITVVKPDIQGLLLGPFHWQDGEPIVDARLTLEKGTRATYTAITDVSGNARFGGAVPFGIFDWVLSKILGGDSYTILDGRIEIDGATPTSSAWWPAGDKDGITSPLSEEEYDELHDINQTPPEKPTGKTEETFIENVDRTVYVGDEEVEVEVKQVSNGTVTADIGIASNVLLDQNEEVLVDIDGDGVNDLKVTYKGDDSNGNPKIEFEDIEVSVDKQADVDDEGYTRIIIFGAIGAVVALVVLIFITKRRNAHASDFQGTEEDDMEEEVVDTGLDPERIPEQTDSEDEIEHDEDIDEAEERSGPEDGAGEEGAALEEDVGEDEEEWDTGTEEEDEEGDEEGDEEDVWDMEMEGGDEEGQEEWDAGAEEEDVDVDVDSGVDTITTQEKAREGIMEHLPNLELQKAPDSLKGMIPGYIITDKLGAGGFATVYKAINKDGIGVAIKMPKFLDETVDSSILNKFQAEADIWKKLRHKNIVDFYDSDIRPIPYMAIELMEGGNLAGLLKMRKMSLEEAKSLIIQIVDGISYAHRMASVHRDIKPENILFTSDGVPKISDWGIGKFMASESVSKSIGTKGTFAYAAPEQFSKKKYGEIDWSTDMFQLGILFYEMLTGENPFFDEDPVMIMANITSEDPEPPSSLNPDIPPELDNIVMKCLEKKKEDRWKGDVLLHELRSMEKRKQTNIKRYRRSLERALKDGRISEDEEDMLAELREHMGITDDEHDDLARELQQELFVIDV